ncbi:MAG: amino acid adenylation domain-containing protein [Clostridia bacterium]|nr:amino acid adenylation domain-containing protein [Clostridia bacterium]
MDKLMQSAVGLLEQAAEKFKNRTVFEDKDGAISFAKLREKSRIVGSELIKRVVTGRTSPVIVYLPKSINSIVCFMGALYSASPYVPVDYAIPLARMEKTAENLSPAAIITDSEGREKLLPLNLNTKIFVFDELVSGQADNDAVDKALNGVCDLDPAYIMYTSGSTGVPKGVTVSHRGVLDYIEWIAETFPVNGDSIIGMQSAFHFDNSVFDMYTAFYTGAKTMIIPEILFMYPEKLMDYMAESRISCIFWVPTVMISAANSGVLENKPLPDLKLILFAGEVMPNTQLNIWRKYLPDCMYVNMYGPTEATDIVTYYVVDREFENHETLPIGKVCGNMRAFILNDDDKLCKTGEQGELCISGTGIALGYWNAPEITEKAFVQNPLNTIYRDRIYRTGDLVYENEEGNIIFLGRKDSQIKLRGNRIELGDLESAAAAVEGVESACALFDADNQEIVLFIETSTEIIARKFKLELKKYVPAYMVPARIITMKKFPHTPSGKIDRVGLRKEYIDK